jgi:hypothetical protein
MSQERVLIEIRTGDLCWTLIVSRDRAMDFIEQWRTSDGKTVLEISGVIDHRDANVATYYLDKSLITGIMVQDIGNL